MSYLRVDGAAESGLIKVTLFGPAGASETMAWQLVVQLQANGACWQVSEFAYEAPLEGLEAFSDLEDAIAAAKARLLAMDATKRLGGWQPTKQRAPFQPTDWDGPGEDDGT